MCLNALIPSPSQVCLSFYNLLSIFCHLHILGLYHLFSKKPLIILGTQKDQEQNPMGQFFVQDEIFFLITSLSSTAVQLITSCPSLS